MNTVGTVGCNNGAEIIYQANQWEDATSYCTKDASCTGIAMHPNGLFTPRCGPTITATAIKWKAKTCGDNFQTPCQGLVFLLFVSCIIAKKKIQWTLGISRSWEFVQTNMTLIKN